MLVSIANHLKKKKIQIFNFWFYFIVFFTEEAQENKISNQIPE